MKEMVKSKGLLTVIILILGITYWNANQMHELSLEEETESLIVMNQEA